MSTPNYSLDLEVPLLLSSATRGLSPGGYSFSDVYKLQCKVYNCFIQLPWGRDVFWDIELLSLNSDYFRVHELLALPFGH